MSIKKNIELNRLMLSGLCVYRHLLADPVIAAFGTLADAAVKRPHIAVGTFMERYSDFFYKLSQIDHMVDFPHYVFDRILLDENAFSISASKPNKKMNTAIYTAATSDIRIMRSLLSITASNIKACFLEENMEGAACQSIIESLPEWVTRQNVPSLLEVNSRQANRIDQGVQNRPASCTCVPADELWQYWNTDTTCEDTINSLVDYHAANGSGIFAGHYAFTWQRTSAGSETNMKHPGYLAPVLNPDPVRLSDLIAYESEREEVIRNTEQFLDGYPANNVLLYGDRGTGKSSTVKALLNEYASRGLRMLEVPKLMLADFPEIISLLSGRPHKFILFVDDLSFEDNEDNFTALKAVIEGGLEVKPQNVLIYATSNRRHLVRENFSDRISLQIGGQDDEISALDTMQEKLSLSDRFGITVVFASPDKKRFLEIVDKLAQKKGIHMDTETLHKEALKWELWYNGRSPRTAQQFINHIGNR
jgi:predicted AAA+ superfamily ATPase